MHVDEADVRRGYKKQSAPNWRDLDRLQQDALNNSKKMSRRISEIV